MQMTLFWIKDLSNLNILCLTEYNLSFKGQENQRSHPYHWEPEEINSWASGEPKSA